MTRSFASNWLRTTAATSSSSTQSCGLRVSLRMAWRRPSLSTQQWLALPVVAPHTSMLHVLSAGGTRHGPATLLTPNPLPPLAETLLLLAPASSRSSVMCTMTRVGVFEANAAHMPTLAPHAEVSTPSGVAQPPAPSHLPSALRPLSFARYLHPHPHTQFVATLITSLTSGFDIGYHGPHRDIRSPNLPSAYEHLTVVDTYLSSECAAGRMAGPFRDPPFTPFHCSGLGAIPKQDGTWRVITHLSAPADRSVNDYIDPEAVTLSYTTIDDAVSIAAKLGRGSLLAKIDLKQAFCQCPVRPADWHLLGLVWKGRYYYDKRLPFGLRSSLFLFNTVASALEYICRTQLDNRHIIHYLDDFLIAGPPHSSSCMDTLQGVEALCRELGIQTKDEKRTLPATAITFLGIHIDTVAQTISVPTEKLAAMLQELAAMRAARTCTKRAILSLIGKLAFAAKAIPAGRIFLRRLIDASTTVSSLHHHMRISAAMKADMDWWSTFAHTWNGRATFLESTWTPSPAFQLFTDASDAGFGCFWQGRWMAGTWTPQQRKRDIQWRELFAVLVAATAWGPHWTSKRLLVHCDNRAVVDIWRVGTSKQPSLMTLVRALFFIAARANFTVLLQHIPGVDNGIADALSRSQLHRFRLLAPGADELPTPTPAVEIST